ncbi:16S rRNA (uracil(1498)-N(3))-methyltransferase [Fulvivirgaceae bacterium BMA10]|uniref:Ribosomal RNA small subunit methyltransferase E n=1 Tax=Splendidivirga corallicola TaxID=3051826 RepID=A0ABT8KR60_9BACT|nr:16S rRNA (uracil(1498)-N(3))-methyltransferase [Fulvivirgaceae bacterium BMA10]
MHLFYQPDIIQGSHFLNEEESRHCVKVMRHKIGDIIKVIDGKGGSFTAQITKADYRKCEFEIIEQSKSPEKRFNIHIGIAPTKNMDRLEWFVEKCVEIGIDEISFIQCQQSERKHLKLDRLERKAISAMKQSTNNQFPKLYDLMSFQQFIENNSNPDQKFIAYVDELIPEHLYNLAERNQRYLVLIGPEGDFSKEEISMAKTNDFVPVSLGKSRLRTETAGIVACHILNLIN